MADPDPSLWFPADYAASRARFRADCAKLASGAGDFCRAWPVSSPTDPDLTIDYAFFGKGGTRLLVIQSGIHGSEAQSGAAVQAFVMNTYLTALLAKGIDVLFIHALDPYGFKNDRRTDEFNVNLNRNFSADGAAYRYVNKDYHSLRYVFEPAGQVGDVNIASMREGVVFFAGLAASGFRTQALNDGLNNGQYEFPQGLNYGGEGPQEQTKFMREAIGPVVSGAYQKVWFLDYHTGLGDAGVLSIILGISPDAGQLAALQQMFAGQDKNGIVIKTSDSPGFFATFGDVIDFAPSLVPDQSKVLAVTMEYGTMGTDSMSELKSATRMILENQAHFCGCASPAIAARIGEDFRELFNPSDVGWRTKVLREADLVFQTLVEEF